MSVQNEELRKIPAVDRILSLAQAVGLVGDFGEQLATEAVRGVLKEVRQHVIGGGCVPSDGLMLERARRFAEQLTAGSLRRVVNATGIVLHTNLGRAPLGRDVIGALEAVTSGYSNLELDLSTGERGSRHSHLVGLLGHLTGAEAAIVVNNNAAAVLLTLGALADGGEVIVSRGELIEIGGSFRMPDIMAQSGACMVEVGTTNKTRVSDFERAITGATKILLKAHRSNFYVGGFTEEVSIRELSLLAQRRGLITVYDLGSGLVRRPKNFPLDSEPDVRGAIEQGADIVTFSGDKLLGGPQAGLIVGRQSLVSKAAAHPLMRALRVGKMTIAALTTVVAAYLNDDKLASAVPVFAMLNRKPAELRHQAEELQAALLCHGIDSDVLTSVAHGGGGTLPGLDLASFAVGLTLRGGKRSSELAYRALLGRDRPVLGVLREGRLLFDVLCLFEGDIVEIARAVADVVDATREPSA